ncbi:S8 family peptidase [Paracrocinitomix mangrovi]|uniref:S8 family peptidase n=1 Tax=Paracrocinitomix mangrovi TaxID=2862509 RepID=UPI001C8E461E|nr:S8 family peptidase [Paracrocinitomix mangrovi]UKN00673.1 S8 family peptidase [Paracrocinitomix mangrovi]
MKLISLLLMLNLSYFGMAQKQAIGLSIVFNESILPQDRAADLDHIKGLQPHDSNLYLKGFEVQLSLFEDGNNIDAIYEEVKAIPSVDFVSFLYRSEEDAYAADLPEVFVKTEHDLSTSEIEELKSFSSAVRVIPYKGLDKVYRIQYDKNCTHKERALVRALNASGKYEIVSQNTLHSVRATTNDPYYNYQWAISNDGSANQFNGDAGADMNVDTAWSYTMGQDYIEIAVLDSGVDTNHVDLVNNLLPGFDATGGGSNGYPNTTYSNDGHGTCCAGIIAAEANNSIGVSGVAPNCKIRPVKIFYYINIGSGPIPFASASAGMDGIIWAVDTANADVLSNSWGLRNSDISTLGVDTAMSNMVVSQKIASGRYGKGVPMLFSSGNDADNYSIWPASHPKTISVGASTMCDELKTTNDCSPENWWGSNYGLNLDVTAPGVKVLATDMSGSMGFNGFTDNDYAWFNGTSAACPNAAGVMALILSYDSTLTVEEARNVISITADKVGGYSYDSWSTYGYWSTQMGYGRVNALSAMQYMNTAVGLDESATNTAKIIYGNDETMLYCPNLNSRINIYDLNGRLVKAVQTTSDLTDLSQSESGIYLIEVLNNNGEREVLKMFQK